MTDHVEEHPFLEVLTHEADGLLEDDNEKPLSAFVPVAEHHALSGDAVAVATTATSFTELPQPDPLLTSRDSAVFLLQLAAEIEHALLVQYLYAAFSVDSSAKGVPDTGFLDIFSTAKEEMGHLMTVQNVLLALGSAPSLYREDMPTDTSFYPFPFMLEPVSKASLAKYVLAEMPDGGLPPHKLSTGNTTPASVIHSRSTRWGICTTRSFSSWAVSATRSSMRHRSHSRAIPTTGEQTPCP